MIEAMIFDAGGVLLESNNTVSDDLKQELGMSQEQVDWVWEKYVQLLGSGKITEEEFWVHLTEDLNIRPVLVEENLLGRAFAANLVKNQELYKFIEELGESGIILAVLSDTVEPHARAMRDAGVFEPFKHIFLSYELGLRKPDPAIYETVLGKLSLRPEEVGFTDDKPTNVDAARALGIQSVVFKSAKQLREDIKNW